jgi:hypothetical protein
LAESVLLGEVIGLEQVDDSGMPGLHNSSIGLGPNRFGFSQRLRRLWPWK